MGQTNVGIELNTASWTTVFNVQMLQTKNGLRISVQDQGILGRWNGVEFESVYHEERISSMVCHYVSSEIWWTKQNNNAR